MKLQEFIDEFNDGEESQILKWFGTMDTFFELIEKNKKWDLLDENIMEDEYTNYSYLHLYRNDKLEFNRRVSSDLDDVELIDGVWYFVGDKTSLAKLFCDNNRNGLSRSTVEEILDGNLDMGSWWSPYDLTDNVYRDVIQELTKENITRLKEYVMDILKGKKISANTDVLESIAQKENTEFVTVSESNIDEIIDDEETMVELMNDELEDLKRELYNIYDSSYNSAYEDELYSEVKDELKKYFDMDNGKFITRPHVYKSNTHVEMFQVPIFNFESTILDYLNNNKRYNNETLYNSGGFIELLESDNDCLNAFPSDYPDSRLIDKNINSFFRDYI